MPSKNVGSKRAETSDAEIPAEIAKGEAQDLGKRARTQAEEVELIGDNP